MHFLNFGEILFDILPTDKKLGGAPLNVAAHLTKLGAEGAIISAIGCDEQGGEALSIIKDLNIDTSFIKLSSFETGRADITLAETKADYQFNFPCAWDDITIENSLPKKVDLIYFGSLAQRSNTSQASLFEVLDSVKAKHIFFDVNFRKNFYTSEIIKSGIDRATILKMNDEEIAPLADALNLKNDIQAIVDFLFKTTNLEMILITLGNKGSNLYTRDSFYHQDCLDIPVIDTVGAGDALSAGFLYTLISTGDVEKALKVGSILADFVVSQVGAIPEYSQNLLTALKDLLS